MPTLPIPNVTLPAVLNGKSNGQLPSAVLWTTPSDTGGPAVTLVEPAARAWRALVAAALEHYSWPIRATSTADSYRSYAQQEALFRARYRTTKPDGATESRTWQGRQWWLVPGKASAAVPGTSNHGWGIAVDIANVTTDRLRWLTTAAWIYGWGWELQSEPWHMRYTLGDAIPAAVLVYEQENEMSELGQQWDGSYAIKRLESLCQMDETYTVTLPDKSKRVETNDLVKAVNTLIARTADPIEIDYKRLAVEIIAAVAERP